MKEKKSKNIQKQDNTTQINDMFSMIAHQWRQPLAAISSNASTLDLKLLLDDYDKETFTVLVKDILAYSQHLSLTINEFRNFFKDSKVTNETTFKSIIDECVKIINISLRDKDIEITVQNNFKDKLHIYESEFKQVVLNLLRNAEDVILENEISKGKIEIKTYADGTNAIFEVKDNGGGISKDIIKNIFDPYFSTKSKKNGTGLGLYMSKVIIETHCLGSIKCLNSKDGAVFRITLNPNHPSLISESSGLPI